MGEELRNLVCFALFDLGVKTLNDHLTQTLRGAHDIGGIDCLVRRDQDETLAPVYHGRIGGLVGADRIVLDGFVGTVLHERNMLVGRCMVDNLGPIVLKYAEDPAAVPDGTDQYL